MKKIFFTTALLLAVASLGLALPPGKGKGKIGFPPTPSAPIITTLALKSETPVPSTLPSSTPAPSTVPSVPSTPAAAPPLSSLPKPFDSVDDVGKSLGIAPACASAVLSIFVSPEAQKCAPMPVFLPLLPIILDPDFLKKFTSDPAGTFKSVEPALVTFANGLCAAPKCSDEGVAGAIKTLSDACKDDLKNNELIQMLFGIIVFYSPIRDNLCFKNDKTKEFCWDESLKTVFGLPKSPIKIIDGGLIDSVAVADPFVMCTRCNKDIVNTFGNFLKDNELALKVLEQFKITETQLTLVKTGIAVKCGINFEDGKIPDQPPK